MVGKIQLIATATFGLEAVVAREVKKLGYEDVQVGNAKVEFTADESAICVGTWGREFRSGQGNQEAGVA